MFYIFFISVLWGLAPSTQVFDCGTKVQQKSFVQSLFKWNRFFGGNKAVLGLHCHYFSGVPCSSNLFLFYQKKGDYLCRGKKEDCLSIDDIEEIGDLEERNLQSGDILVVYGIEEGQKKIQHTYVYYRRLIFDKRGDSYGGFGIHPFVTVKQLLSEATFLWFQSGNGSLFETSFVRLFRPRKWWSNKDRMWQFNFIFKYKDLLNSLLFYGKDCFSQYSLLDISRSAQDGDNGGWNELWQRGLPQKMFPDLFDENEALVVGSLEPLESESSVLKCRGSFMLSVNQQGDDNFIYTFFDCQKTLILSEYVFCFKRPFLDLFFKNSSLFWFDSGLGTYWNVYKDYAKKLSIHLVGLTFTYSVPPLFNQMRSDGSILYLGLNSFWDTDLSFYQKQCSIITDYYGIHSYTSEVSNLLTAYQYLLHPDGAVFLYGEYTDVVYVGSEKLSYVDWLRSCQVFEVTESQHKGKCVLELRLKNRSYQVPQLHLLGVRIQKDRVPQRFFIQEKRGGVTPQMFLYFKCA